MVRASPQGKYDICIVGDGITVLSNQETSQTVVNTIVSKGVSCFCICAGARNAPLVSELLSRTDVEVINFFDERSASFFALGRIHQSQKPVAVVTTSGTAVSECFSAMVEAYYQGLPLVLLTADRPRHFRQTGAPQAIEQKNIFGIYARQSFDLSVEDRLENISETLQSWSAPKGSLHLNICLDDPLRPMTKISSSATADDVLSPRHALQESDYNEKFVQPLVIVSGLEKSQRARYADFLSHISAPILLETTSGLFSMLDSYPALKKNILLGGEATAEKLLKNKICRSVIRLGSVPTTKIWRQLESVLMDIPVVSVSEQGFSGLSRENYLLNSIDSFAVKSLKNHADLSVVKDVDATVFQMKQRLYEKYPLAEISWMRKLAQKAQSQFFYVGNSLPIRELDFVASPEVSQFKDVLANRGANGIDGQISTFLGWAQDPQHDYWCVIGDLTAMYDLNALWSAPKSTARQLRLVVINNQGGQIFKPMFPHRAFINEHQIEFSNWAKMWNWSYAKVTNEQDWENLNANSSVSSGSAAASLASSRLLIEVVPDEKQSTQFLKDFEV